MNIALVTNGIAPFVLGGMQQHSISLGIELVKSGHKVDLFHFVHKNQKILSKNEINYFFFNKNYGFENVFCTYFPSSIKFPGHYIWNSIKYSKWVYNIIIRDENKYDFIYSKGFSSWEILKNKKEINCKSKIGIKFHGYEMFQYSPNLKIKLQNIMFRPFVKYINRNADYIFSYGGKISEIIKKLGVPNDKIIEIPSAIDSSWVKDKIKTTKKVIKFLYVGRYERRKGINEIYKSVLELSKNQNNLEFHFLGPIPNHKKINISNIKIKYYGLIKNDLRKQEIYDSCDVLICPSYSEGMPNVILEAMSRGLAIISSDVGAISKLVCSENGILINKINSNSIKCAIKNITNDKNLLNQMKYSSIRKVQEQFLWTNISKLINSELNYF